MSTVWTPTTSIQHFQEARFKATITKLIDTLRQRPSQMLSLDDLRSRLNVRGQRSLGHQVVPLDQIIGSEGRYADFDRRFLPRSDALKDRWVNIDRAMVNDVTLPPVDLYKIGDVYFVRDGNHRVSVARQLGQAEIDANVTELLTDVAVTQALSARTLLLTQEYSDFLEWTDLHALRPDERIEFSELGGYLELVSQINAHRRALERSRGGPVARDEAVASWYDTIYLPAVGAIRQGRLPRSRTEADMYRRSMLSACN